MNDITMQLVADKYIKMALEEDINSEDINRPNQPFDALVKWV